MLVEILVLSCSTMLVYHNFNNKPKTAKIPQKSQHNQLVAQKNRKKISISRLVKDIRSSFQEESTQALHLDIDPGTKAEIDKARRENRRNLLISTGAVGMAVLGAFNPAYFWISAAAVIYLARGIFVRVWLDAKRGHFISVYILDILSTVGLLVSGNVLFAALGGLIGGFFANIITKLEEKSNHQLLNVFSGHPQNIWLLRDNVEVLVPFNTVQADDHVVVNAGEIIAVDGYVYAGEGSVDQRTLTGESQPVEKNVGEQVFASTLLETGRLVITVEKSGNSTMAAKIGNVLENTKAYQDTLMMQGRQMADGLVPYTLAAAAISVPTIGPQAILPIFWASLGDTLAPAGSLTLIGYLQILARNHILVKDGRVFESLRKVDTFIFDKTGTLSEEQPTVGQIHVFGQFDTHTVLRYTAAAEFRQTHPIAKAILAKAAAEQITLIKPDEAKYEVGYGIKVKLEDCLVRVGSARFLENEGIVMPDSVQNIQAQAASYSYSLIYVAVDNELAGVLEMQPTIRPEALQIVQYLQQRGIDIYIISGDHEGATRQMAEALNIEHYIAGVLPENKAEWVKKLCDEGRYVCFVGDGINDAIALKTAQVSISLKGASSAATDMAQIIFMDGTLKHLPDLLQYADEFDETMHRNLLLSVLPGTFVIGGVYLLHFGIATAMGIFYLSCVFALMNVLWPIAKHQQDEEQLERRLDAPDATLKV